MSVGNAFTMKFRTYGKGFAVYLLVKKICHRIKALEFCLIISFIRILNNRDLVNLIGFSLCSYSAVTNCTFFSGPLFLFTDQWLGITRMRLELGLGVGVDSGNGTT